MVIKQEQKKQDLKEIIDQIKEENPTSLDLSPVKRIKSLGIHKGPVRSVAINNKFIISGSYDKTIKIWDINTGKEVETLKGHTDSVLSVAIKDDYIVSGSSDKTIKIWDINTGKEVKTLRDHSSSVLSIAIKDNYIVSGAGDGTIKVWNINTEDEIIRTLQGHTHGIKSIAIKDNYIVSGSSDRTIIIWNIITGEAINTLIDHADPIYSVAIKDGYIISGSYDKTIKIWDISTGKVLNTLKGHTSCILSVAINDAFIVSGSSDTTIGIYSYDIVYKSKKNSIEACKSIKREFMPIIDELPENIGELISLKNLDISGNRIKKMPKAIGKLRNLERINLEGNPVMNIDNSIIEQGAEAIVSSFKGDETTVLNEIRMLMVGAPRAGKTSIVKYLKGEPFDKNQVTTIGLADTVQWISQDEVLKNLQFPDDTGMTCTPLNMGGVKFNIWDFGGQQIFYSTHKFFLSERCIYILVLDGEKNEADNDIEYWLSTIKSMGEGSPVFVVRNKSDVYKSDIELSKYNLKFPGLITGFFQTSCKNEYNKGIEDLKKEVSKVVTDKDKMPHVVSRWNSSWFAAREAITEKSKAETCIGIDTLHIIFEENGVTEEKDYDILDKYLHELGIILHFKEDRNLNNYVMLNPAWTTKAFYKLIAEPKVKDEKGKVKFSKLNEYWDENEYPKDKHGALMDLMEKFELCFPVDEKKTAYIIPECLPADKPKSFEWDEKDSTVFEYDYGEYIPSSIFPRLLVKLHQYLPKKNQVLWKTGASFEYEAVNNCKAQAFIQADFYNRTLTIKLKGKCLNEFLAIVRREIDKINSSFKDLKSKKYILCNCGESGCTDKISLSDAVMKYQAERHKIDCRSTPTGKMNLKTLLGAYLPEPQMREIEEEKERIVKVENKIINNHIANNSDKVNVSSSVGGDSNVTVVNQGQDNKEFTDAVLKVIEEIQKCKETELDEKNYRIENLNDLSEEVSKPQPNKSKIKGLVEGLNTAFARNAPVIAALAQIAITLKNTGVLS